jgi:hypothetical protein
MFSKSPFGDFVHSLSSLFKQRLAPGECPATISNSSTEEGSFQEQRNLA